MRFQPYYERFARAEDRAEALREMSAEEIVQALAAASRSGEPLLANVLATEAINRLRRVKTAIHHLGEGVCLIDAEGRVILLNPTAERLTGWRRAEVEGRHAQETILSSSTWREVLRARRALHSEEERFVRKGGMRFPASCTLAPVVSGEAVDGVVIVFRDVTRERFLEEARREWNMVTEASYRAHDVIGEGIVLIEGMRILQANETFVHMTGYGLEELRGLDITALVPEKDRMDVTQGMQEVMRRTQYHVQVPLVCRDGMELKVEVAAVPVQIGARPPCVVCIVRHVEPEGRAPGAATQAA